MYVCMYVCMYVSARSSAPRRPTPARIPPCAHGIAGAEQQAATQRDKTYITNRQTDGQTDGQADKQRGNAPTLLLQQ